MTFAYTLVAASVALLGLLAWSLFQLAKREGRAGRQAVFRLVGSSIVLFVAIQLWGARPLQILSAVGGIFLIVLIVRIGAFLVRNIPDEGKDLHNPTRDDDAKK